jgi:hypothetical protein
MNITGKVVVGLGAAALLYEGYTLINREKRDTISEFMWPGVRRPLVSFVLGAIASHLVWQSQDVYDAITRQEFRERREARRRLRAERRQD